MTDATVRQAVPAWIWGGALIVAQVFVSSTIGRFSPVGAWLGQALFAAAMVVFAFGLRGRGSVVARQSVGVVALLMLAFVPPVFSLFIPSDIYLSDAGTAQTLGYLSVLIPAAAALVAVVTIGRARVVPDPWRWAPAWALAALAALYALTQVTFVALGDALGDPATLAVFSAVSVVPVLVPVALGVLAIILGARGVASAPTQVYPPV